MEEAILKVIHKIEVYGFIAVCVLAVLYGAAAVARAIRNERKGFDAHE